MSILNLKQLMSISQYCQLKDEVLLPTSKTKRAQWVISRALCLFRLFDFRHIPKDAQNQALDFELKNHGPFEQTDYYVIWSNGLAQVWLWDKSATQAIIKEHGAEVFEIVPETILRQKPTSNGLALAKNLEDSVDLQFWSEGVLIGSRECSAKPSEGAIHLFVKGLPQLPNFKKVPNFRDLDKSSVKVISSLPLTEHHCLQTKKQYTTLRGLNLESLIVIVVLTLLLGFIEWETIANIKTNWQITELEAQAAKNREIASVNVGARAETIISTQKSTLLLDIIDYPSQVQLMSIFGPTIIEKGDKLKEWKYNLNQLELVIETATTSSLIYVNLLQKKPMVKSVTSEPGRIKGQIKLLIELNLNKELTLG